MPKVRRSQLPVLLTDHAKVLLLAVGVLRRLSGEEALGACSPIDAKDVHERQTPVRARLKEVGILLEGRNGPAQQLLCPSKALLLSRAEEVVPVAKIAEVIDVQGSYCW